MPTLPPASDIAAQLANNVEWFCRRYLSNGYRSGRYWCVGDVFNAQGGSLYVRLTGPASGKGRRGKWQDAATGEHGDLLDVIRLQRGEDWRDALAEARAFLSLPEPPEPERREALPPGAGHHGVGPAHAALRAAAGWHPGGGIPALTRDRARREPVGLTLPPALPLSAVPQASRSRHMAPGAARYRHRSRGWGHGGGADLARAGRARQGRSAEAPPRARQPARPRRALSRHRVGRDGGRRGRRVRAVGAPPDAIRAPCGCALGRAPCRPEPAGGLAPALHRPRRRRGRGAGSVDPAPTRRGPGHPGR